MTAQTYRTVYRCIDGTWYEILQAAWNGGSWYSVGMHVANMEKMNASMERARIAIREAENWRFA